ncbi:MAG: 50S ribosomal protein L3 [Myxococcales bacterium]|nr:50S ribosomal protein L3 [Myxococcales bacterium]
MNTHPGILGTKLGMTQIFLADGTVVPCTAVQAGCIVVSKRTKEKDGYDALVLGIGDRKPKNASKSVRVACEKAIQKVPAVQRELRTTAEFVAKYEVGQIVRVEDVFEEGQRVDVQSRSIGRGFQGVVKKFGFAGLNMTHGTHEWRRHGGSIGTNMTPGRVFLGKKMPGQMGNATVTVVSQRIAKILPDEQVVLLEGSVPGSRNAVVRMRGAVKRKNAGKPKA